MGHGRHSRRLCFDALPDDFAHFEPILNAAIARFPELADAGVNLFFNGPESFTPDDRYLLGPTPEAENLFVACGFNSIGIQSSGGAGKVLAQWMRQGKPPMDLWDVDVRRTFPFQSQKIFYTSAPRNPWDCYTTCTGRTGNTRPAATYVSANCMMWRSSMAR